jgi:signal transduction histidine kinase
LRTPINGVGPILDLLLDDPGALVAPDARELLLLARESASRLEGTIQSILRYHDALRGVTAPVIAGSATSWVDVLRAVVDEAGLVDGLFAVEGEGGERLLPGRSAESMHLVLSEFIENYVKFSQIKEHGLMARFSRTQGEVTLRLFSPGPEMTPEMLSRLGTAYWQQEKRFTGEVPGTGLGLATCRLILGSMGAELTFGASERPSGLVINVSLPSEP